MKFGDYVELTIIEPAGFAEEFGSYPPRPRTHRGYVVSLSKDKITLNTTPEFKNNSGSCLYTTLRELSLDEIVKIAHFKKVAEVNSLEVEKVTV